MDVFWQHLVQRRGGLEQRHGLVCLGRRRRKLERLEADRPGRHEVCDLHNTDWTQSTGKTAKQSLTAHNYYAEYVHFGEQKETVWCPSICLSSLFSNVHVGRRRGQQTFWSFRLSADTLVAKAAKRLTEHKSMELDIEST